MNTERKELTIEIDGCDVDIVLDIEWEDGKPNIHGDGWIEETPPVITDVEWVKP